MYISVYNLFYTSLPVLAVGIFDQDVSDKNSLLYPQLYKPGHVNLFFNKKEFLLSALQGCYVSLVLFFIPFGEFGPGDVNGERDCLSVFDFVSNRNVL